MAGLPVCAAVGFGFGGIVPSADRAIPWVKDRFLSQYAIAPETVYASSSAKGYDARLATDGVDNKAWAPAGSPSQAPGQYWQATFESPFRLTALLMINGAATKPAAFFESGRPTRVTVTITTADKKTVKRQMNLADQPGVQSLNVGIDQVTAVQIMIDTVHPGLKAAAPIALAEVQFFSRRQT
ncbi:NADase-type glycan-binding domain-containing protein [Streptomyces vinaceus]